ncbi:MAG TPA: hypothetical protein PLD25_32360 [Chloroflexota bacterium]|nr:hypothetical protein [Chloroflexota bacterium]HUM69087.1 hypothetical protein [Chloroflexota bacterium]
MRPRASRIICTLIAGGAAGTLTRHHLVATLDKIVAGQTQIEARSLQQAFAEVNASLRQANTIIGGVQHCGG